MRKRLGVMALFTVLTACGGGGGGDSSNNNNGNNQQTASVYTPSAAVLAARQTNYPTAFHSPWSSGTVGCAGTLSTVVYVLPNTVTYAAAGVTEAAQQQAAEYAEQAVAEVKAAFGVSATTGFGTAPVDICAMVEPIYGSQGMGYRSGLVVLSANSTNMPTNFLTNDFVAYKKLIKHELVHTYQQYALNTTPLTHDTDIWFSEGLAEYVANGQTISTTSKADILSLVSGFNPIMASNGSISFLKYYPSFHDSIAYLFGDSGAKNSIKMIPAFFATHKANWAAFQACVQAGGSVGTTCPSIDGVFVNSFESSFKEADGSAMKLRSGTNNLQDTIASRLTAFLQ